MSDGPPPRFRLSLLGSFALSGPNGLVDLSSKKLVGLLAYSCRPLSLQRQLFDFERISSRISRNSFGAPSGDAVFVAGAPRQEQMGR
jgi:hypothetical protein